MAILPFEIPENIRNLSKQTDIMLAVGIIAILVVMILPLPALLLDVLLTMSITLGVMILLVSIYANEPLDFSTFPFVLLISTLFRLSLNVATTRRILLHGHEGESAAGDVIQAFGQFVVGGNYVVGIIVFAILVIINFMVITKGSGRVAEVAARFTLDAMPGKQMAIDADLNAGLIDESEAKKRREKIRMEADFYGSMDGASKFVRGDAVAGLIITAINILAGLIIGSAQQGMPIADAAARFTILTIGDGLVSQIPALIISTAAGIVVTRAGGNSEDGNLSQQLGKQLIPNTRVLFIGGGILAFFGLIPGMPKISFFLLSAILLGSGWLMQKRLNEAPKKDDADDDSPEPTEDDEVKDLLEMDTLELEIGFALIPLVDASQGGTLLNRIKAIRRQIATEMGFIVPPVRIRDNLQLEATSYAMLLKGVRAATSTVQPDMFLVMNPEGDLDQVDGINTKEPAFGLDAKWINSAEKEIAEIESYTIVDPATVIATHLTEVIKTNAHDLLGRQETQELLEGLKEKFPKLVEDLVPGILDIGIVNRVLQNLLKERVSIRNLQTVLETLATYGSSNKDIEYLTEKARFSLRRQITDNLLGPENTLYVFTLPSQVEQLMAKSLQPSDEGKDIVIDPQIAQAILSATITKVDSLVQKGLPPVLVISPPLRYAMRRFAEKFIPNLNIISHNEISETAKIESLGVLEIKQAQ